MKCEQLDLVSAVPGTAGAVSGLFLLSDRVSASDRGDVDPLETHSVDRVLSGDSSAFNYLVSKYIKRVVSIAYGFVRDPSSAEDLAQEAFVKAYQNLHRFRRGERFGPWIFRIVSNLALDQLKRTKRGPDDELTETQAAKTHGAEERLEMNEIARQIDLAIESLPPMQRHVARLYLVEEMSHQDIAAILELSVGTVRSHLSHARAKLQLLLRDLSPEGS